MMIQNEIDYGNLFNRDPKYKNKICFHWDNAYAIYENNKNTVFFWNVGVLFYEAYSELLHPNPSVDRIGSLLKECFSAYQENLNSYFFYLKARILKSIVELIYMPDKINLEYLKQTYQYVQRYTNKGMLLTISHIYAYLNQNRRNAEGNWHQAFHYLMQLCDGQGLEKNKHIALIAEFSYQIIKTGHLLSEDEVDFLPSELKLLVKSRKNDRQWKTLRSKGLLYFYADDIFYPYI